MKNKFYREVPGLVLTGARYGMAERIAHKVREDKPVAGDLATFVAADIADGVILRQFNADTPLRRVADGVVDHASMARVGYEAARKNPASRAYFGALAIRAALVGSANTLHLIKTGEVTKGNEKQRVVNLATAAFGLVALTGNKKATHIAGIVTAGLSLATAIPHLKGIGRRNQSGIREL